MNSRSRSRSGRNKAKTLKKLVEEEFHHPKTASSSSLSVSSEDIDDNTLTKKRKLLRKPLKLRRGHLQEPSSGAYLAAGHNHLTAVPTDDDPSDNSLLSREFPTLSPLFLALTPVLVYELPCR